jgi:hypothetical protein
MRVLQFEEVVVRLFLAAVWRQACALQNTASLLDQDGDGDLDDDDLDELFDECDADGARLPAPAPCEWC